VGWSILLSVGELESVLGWKQRRVVILIYMLFDVSLPFVYEMPFDLCETHTNLYKPEINLSAKFKTNFAKYQIQLHFLNTFRDEHSEEWTGVIFSLCIDLIYFVKRINSILHSIS
jgi:hypothetical protein